MHVASALIAYGRFVRTVVVDHHVFDYDENDDLVDHDGNDYQWNCLFVIL